MTALAVEDLRVAASDGTALLRGVSLAVASGAALTILGETGGGKTLVAETVVGTLAPGLRASGRVVVEGAASDAGERGARRALWGRRLALLPQEPWSALDPTMRASPQVVEGYRFVRGLGAREARARAAADLGALGLNGAGRRFPHQLSGGMAQRVAFAAARAGGAPLLLADEPTKGLDAAMRDAVVTLLRAALDAGGALLCITHDVAVARALGGEVAVMLDGAVVEHGPAARVLSAPAHAYTRRLLAAEPAAWPDPPPAPRHGAPLGDGPAITAEGLAVSRGGRVLFSGLDFALARGEWAAATGPSGCGKTSLGDALLGLRAPAAGRVRRAAGAARTAFQKVYQNPVAAFAPHVPLRTALAEAARLHGVAWPRAAALLARLRVADALLDRRPDQVSGGELQRVALARALLPDPVFLFADEPTSRLDPVTQRETMTLLREVSAERGVAVLLVTHDAAMAAKMAGAGRVLALGERAGTGAKPTV